MRERERLSALKQVSQDMADAMEARTIKRGGSALVTRGSYAEKIMQAGLSFSPSAYRGIILSISFGAAYIASFLGLLLAIFIFFILLYYLAFGYLEERSVKRRKIILPQFPAFIDSLAAGLGTGFNLEGAIIEAAKAVPPGLFRTELDKVVDALERGYSTEESIGIMRRRITGKEVTSLVVCLQLFHGMGGRLLEPFRRLSRKIREQQVVVERAGRDLVQVKQAFSILLFLSAGSPFLLMLIQPDYLNGALVDPLGRILLQLAAIIQVSSVAIFKAVTNLKM